MFDYNEIALFIKVVETGSFTEASRQLGIPKGTISRKVAQLEERLGTRLMQRNTRTLNITDAGRDLAGRCGGLLAQLEEATSGVRLGHAELAGNIRLAAPSCFVRHVLSQWVPSFMERYPGITFEVITSNTGVDLLEQGADIAFFVGNLPDSSFIARSIGDPKAVLVASPAYLSKHGTPESPEDLQGHNSLTYGTSSGRAQWEFTGVTSNFRVDITPRAASYDFDFLVTAALNGLGIAQVPHFLVSKELHNGRLSQVLPEHRTVIGDVSMIYPSNRYLPTRVREFIDYVVTKNSDASRPVVDAQVVPSAFFSPHLIGCVVCSSRERVAVRVNPGCRRTCLQG